MGYRVRHPHAAFPVLLEAAASAEQLRRSGRKGEALSFQKHRRTILSIALHELWLVVVHIQIRWRPGQVQVDDTFRFCGKMRLFRSQWVGQIGRRRRIDE